MKKQRIFAFLAAVLFLGATGCQTASNTDLRNGSPVEKTEEDDIDDEEVTRRLTKQLEKEKERRAKSLAAISSKSLASLNAFSLRAAPMLLADEGSNRVCSPLSLYLALSMLAETTDGETRAEVLETLGLPDTGAARKLTGGLFDALCFDNDAGRMALANSLWLNQNYPFRKGITETVERGYRAELYSFDHTNPADGQRIADWIAANTGGMLTPAPLELNAQSLAILINTVYYQDQWVNQMRPSGTAPDTFTLSDGSRVTCDFMASSGEQSYAEGDGWTKTSKAFRNGGTMSFILPDEGTTPAELLADGERLEAALTGPTEQTRCSLRLPKFDFQTTSELSEAVRSLGIRQALDADRADFSPLTNVEPVFVSRIEQGAAVTVDENGCKAAAYTELAIAAGVITEEFKEMTLNRPFLFTIEGPRTEQGASGPLLFVGVVENPAE